MKTTAEVIAEYLAVFRARYPMLSEPIIIDQKNGWLRMERPDVPGFKPQLKRKAELVRLIEQATR